MAEFDFTSEKFDPLLVLYENVAVPFPEANPFNNLAAYDNAVKRERLKNPTLDEETVLSEFVLQPSRPKARLDRTAAASAPGRSLLLPPHARSLENASKTGASMPPTQSTPRPVSKHNRNILTRMEAVKDFLKFYQSKSDESNTDVSQFFNCNVNFSEGPLSLLRRCVQQQIQVKVWTRSFNYIRGFCKGYIVAYDKHFNLAMLDVDETYRKPIPFSSTKKKHKKKNPVPASSINSNITPDKDIPSLPATATVLKDCDEKNTILETSKQGLALTDSECTSEIAPTGNLSLGADDARHEVVESDEEMIALTQTLHLASAKDDQNNSVGLSTEHEEGKPRVKSADINMTMQRSEFFQPTEVKSMLSPVSLDSKNEGYPENITANNQCKEQNLYASIEPAEAGESKKFPDKSKCKEKQVASEQDVTASAKYLPQKKAVNIEVKGKNNLKDSLYVLKDSVFPGKLKTMICKRHVNQLFIRGDNVVLVSIVD